MSKWIDIWESILLLNFLKKIKDFFLLKLYKVSRTFLIVKEISRIEFIKDDLEKNRSRFCFLEKCSEEWGFKIYNQNLTWFKEQDFLTLKESFPDLRKQRPDRKFVLWSLVNYSKNLNGDTAECGIFRGSSTFIICSILKDKNGIHHHAFDSFEGLSKPSSHDLPNSKYAFTWKEGDLKVTKEEVEESLRSFNFIKYYKGWIPEKFFEVQDILFSFVHIDVDLYQPTKDSLEFFYPRMVKGGILLCDDYGYDTCPGARKAFDDFIQNREEKKVIHLTTGQGFIIKS